MKRGILAHLERFSDAVVINKVETPVSRSDLNGVWKDNDPVRERFVSGP